MKPPGKPITAERIDRALNQLAEIMVASPSGDRYLPIYERLELELAAFHAKEDKMAAVRQRAEYSKQGRTLPRI